MKIVQVLENYNILREWVTKAVNSETKKQEGKLLGTRGGTLGQILLGNLLSGRGIVRAGSENKKGKGIVRAGYGKEWDF